MYFNLKCRSRRNSRTVDVQFSTRRRDEHCMVMLRLPLGSFPEVTLSLSAILTTRFGDPRFRDPRNLLKSDSVLECIKAGIHGAFKHSSTMTPSLPALNTDVTGVTATLRLVGGAVQRTTSLFIRMFLAEPSLQEFSAIVSDSWASPTSRGRLS